MGKYEKRDHSLYSQCILSNPICTIGYLLGKLSQYINIKTFQNCHSFCIFIYNACNVDLQTGKEEIRQKVVGSIELGSGVMVAVASLVILANPVSGIFVGTIVIFDGLRRLLG